MNDVTKHEDAEVIALDDASIAEVSGGISLIPFPLPLPFPCPFPRFPKIGRRVRR
ncbi:MAG: hypothetical protein ACK5M4_15030 [Pseudorhodobacter sp.]